MLFHFKWQVVLVLQINFVKKPELLKIKLNFEFKGLGRGV